MLRLLSRYTPRLQTDSVGCRIAVPVTAVLLNCLELCGTPQLKSGDPGQVTTDMNGLRLDGQP